jgi:hypothetical protein
MASVKERTEKVTKVVEVEESTGYDLSLSAEEAEALHDILRRIGGPPDLSRRGLIEGIVLALAKNDVKHTDGSDINGTIFFRC